jgi:hypothetical protein
MKTVTAILSLLMFSSMALAQELGSKVYIPRSVGNKTVDDGNKVVTTTGASFDLVIGAELFKEKLPLTLVIDSAQADYTMQWGVISEGQSSGGFHKELYTVSASLLGRDNQVVWSGSVYRKNLHDCAVDITKQLKDAMKHKK